MLLRTFIRFFPLIHSNKNNTHGIQPTEDKETMGQRDVDMLSEDEEAKKTPAIITVSRRGRTAEEQQTQTV